MESVPQIQGDRSTIITSSFSINVGWVQLRKLPLYKRLSNNLIRILLEPILEPASKLLEVVYY